MKLLCYFKLWIPTPEEAGINSYETEVANKEVEKLQTNLKKEIIFDMANYKSQIKFFCIKWQIIKIIFQRFCSFCQNLKL